MDLMPDPLRWSACGFNTQDSRPQYGHGAPLEGPVETLPQPAALRRLDCPDGSLWWLLTTGTTSVAVGHPCWPCMPLPLWW